MGRQKEGYRARGYTKIEGGILWCTVMAIFFSYVHSQVGKSTERVKFKACSFMMAPQLECQGYSKMK